MRRSALFLFTAILLAANAASAARAPRSAAPAATTSRRAAKAPAAEKVPTNPHGYSAVVNSQNQLFVGLAVDHSESNKQPVAGGENKETKMDAIANAVNGNFQMLLAHSQNGVDPNTNEVVVKPWFKMKAVAYSTGVRPLIKGLSKAFDVAELIKSAVWVDIDGKPTNNEDDMVEMRFVDPVANGATHMGEGLAELVPDLKAFVKANPHAPAPVVVHITDGEPRGGRMNAVEVAREIMSLGTSDGHALLFNINVGTSGTPFMFPNEKQIEKLPMEMRIPARRLCAMSAPMPAHMIAKARTAFPEFAKDIKDDARLLVYNAPGAILTQLLEMGTRQVLSNE